MGDWERGRSLPGLKAIIAIIDNFNVTADWLLWGKDNLSPDPFPLLPKLTPEERKMLDSYLEFLLFRRTRGQDEKEREQGEEKTYTLWGVG